jgi:acyl-CoA reductase-like NAD-dependent aldehyde dehydrogenase
VSDRAAVTGIRKVEAPQRQRRKEQRQGGVAGRRNVVGDALFKPTVADRCYNPTWSLPRKRPFGPIEPLYRFKSDDEAVKTAYNTEFGLAAYFYSRDIGRIWRVAEGLEYRIVGINDRALRRHERRAVSAAKARNTASKSSSKSNSAAWAVSIAGAQRQRHCAGGVVIATVVTSTATLDLLSCGRAMR